MKNASRTLFTMHSLRYVMLGVLLLAGTAFFSWRSWQDARQEETARLATIADLGSKIFESWMTRLDGAMQGLGSELTTRHGKLDLGAAFTAAERFQSRFPELKSVMLIRADGQMLLTGRTSTSSDMPSLAADPEFTRFRAALQKQTGIVMGRPLIGRIDNDTVVVPVRYGIRDRSGKLAYILIANLPEDLLANLGEGLAEHGSIGLELVHDAGFMVSHYPKLNGEEPAQLHEPAADGVHVSQRLKAYPLTLAVETPCTQVRARWWRQVRVPYLLVALMLAGLGLMYLQALRRHRVWSPAQREEEAYRNYENAVHEQGQNEVYIFKGDSLGIIYANDYALNHLGCTQEEVEKQDFLSLHPELTKESITAQLEPLRRGEKKTVRFETMQVRTDGTVYPVEVNLQAYHSEAGEEFLAMVYDITEFRELLEPEQK